MWMVVSLFLFPLLQKLDLITLYLYFPQGWRVIGVFGSLIWSKTLMERIFNPYGEFGWSLEGPVSQIYSPHLNVGAPEIFSDLLRSVQMLKGEKAEESNRKLRHLFIPSKTATWFQSLQWKTCLRAEVQPWCLSLQWKTCPWAEHSDDDVFPHCILFSWNDGYFPHIF